MVYHYIQKNYLIISQDDEDDLILTKGGSNLEFLIKSHISKMKKPLIKKVIETIFETYSD